MEKLYKVKDIANRFDVSEETVYRWLRSNRLRGFKAGGLWRIRESDLEAFINGRGAGSAHGVTSQRQKPVQVAGSALHSKSK